MRYFNLILLFLLAACSPASAVSITELVSQLPDTATPTVVERSTPTLSPTPVPLIPDFHHIVIIAFENKEFGTVIGNSDMPFYNRNAAENTLLTQFYAALHPSLPNYITLIGGDTFGITTNCEKCFIDSQSLPDLIESSGRTWRTYQEDLPTPCFVGSKGNYAQKHNPFIYFDPIRNDKIRCEASIVSTDQLYLDLAAGQLPDFTFITPNMCHSGHDCTLDRVDAWLAGLVPQLINYLENSNDPWLIVFWWDEGQGNHSCCGLPEEAGGRIPVVLISPQVQKSLQDDTPYTTYSLLKTISTAWSLPLLGKAADENNVLIEKPFK